MTDSPELVVAKRLLGLARDHGFVFQRIAPGADGPIVGFRETLDYRHRGHPGEEQRGEF